MRANVAFVAGLLLLPAPAGARAATPHGTAAPESPPAAAPPVSPPNVAAAAVGRSAVDAVTCRTGCLGLATATAGSVVRSAATAPAQPRRSCSSAGTGAGATRGARAPGLPPEPRRRRSPSLKAWDAAA